MLERSRGFLTRAGDNQEVIVVCTYMLCVSLYTCEKMREPGVNFLHVKRWTTKHG